VAGAEAQWVGDVMQKICRPSGAAVVDDVVIRMTDPDGPA